MVNGWPAIIWCNRRMSIADVRRERLKALVDDQGLAEVARRVGKPASQISDMLAGRKSFGEKVARAMERAHGGIPEGWLDGANTSANVKWSGIEVAALGADDSHSDDYIQIRESEVHFAAGNGRTAHYDELAESVPATYRREWFAKEGINPDNARRFKVHGDSMEPFLYDGDTVLVHLGESTVINGKVYALRYGDELRIKRVYKKLDGGLILHSDSPDYLPRDEELSPAMVQEHISIIGRVRDKSGTGGL